MTKRYQHVTDAIRTDVAGQMGELIWQATSEITPSVTITRRRHTLAAILPLVEEALNDSDEHVDIAELQLALADLHYAISETNND